MVLRRAETADLDRLVLALQRAAYAKNRPLLGVEPMPLLADYAAIVRDMEVWMRRQENAKPPRRRPDPRAARGRPSDLEHRRRPGRAGSRPRSDLLAAAERRARKLGRTVIRLYTGHVLGHLVGWYGRHGFAVERIEALSDRSITHMIKHLGPPLEP